MSRSVKGSFFLEYVRMIRRQKDLDRERQLPPEDLRYLRETIELDGWYPMETFERFGLVILSGIPGATLDSVRLWGRFSAGEHAKTHPTLIALGQPMESLMRLKVLRSTFFDFAALEIPTLVDGQATVLLNYQMGKVAEEAACYQTMGFFESVLSMAGASKEKAEFTQRRWRGDPMTRMVVEWE